MGTQRKTERSKVILLLRRAFASGLKHKIKGNSLVVAYLQLWEQRKTESNPAAITIKYEASEVLTPLGLFYLQTLQNLSNFNAFQYKRLEINDHGMLYIKF